MQDVDLEDLFAQLRAAAPLPSATLLARINADALAEQAVLSGVLPRARATARSRLAAWVAALGGRVALGGLAAATLAGIWIGIAQPAPISSVTQAVAATYVSDASPDEVDLLSGLDAYPAEG